MKRRCWTCVADSRFVKEKKSTHVWPLNVPLNARHHFYSSSHCAAQHLSDFRTGLLFIYDRNGRMPAVQLNGCGQEGQNECRAKAMTRRCMATADTRGAHRRASGSCKAARHGKASPRRSSDLRRGSCKGLQVIRPTVLCSEPFDCTCNFVRRATTNVRTLRAFLSSQAVLRKRPLEMCGRCCDGLRVVTPSIVLSEPFDCITRTGQEYRGREESRETHD